MSAPLPIRVLVLEDNPSDADLMVDALRQAGFDPQWELVDSAAAFADRLGPTLDLILSDYSLPQFSGIEALRLVRARGLDVPFILVSGSIGEEIAVEAMRGSADDYLLKDRMARLGPAVRQALETRRLRVEKKRAEAAQHESDARFRQMAEHIREVFWLTDPSKNEMLYVSPAYEEIWGRRCEELFTSPRAWIEAIHPEDRGRVLEAAQTRQAPGGYAEEYRVLRPDGSMRWIWDRAFPVLDDAGTVIRIAGIAEDITERKSTVDALRESERRFSDMLGKVELVSLMLDRDARVTYCNDYLLRLTGWRREDVLGRNWFERFLPPPHDEMRAVFASLLADQPAAWHHENEILTRAGARRLIHWNNSVLRSAEGEVIGTASIGEDITERKESEYRIRRLNRVYAVLSGINTLIVRAGDRDELFREACRIAVEQGRFEMAWIGAYDPAGRAITPVAWAGTDAERLARIGASGGSVPLGRGVTGAAVQDKVPVAINDLAAAPDIGSARRVEAIRLGYRSAIGLPLVVEGAAIGALSLYAREPNFFDQEELKLLSELADDISFAVDHMARQRKIDKLSRIRAVSSEINAAIVHSRYSAELLEKACRIAVDHGKFGIAWIGTFDARTMEIVPAATAGLEDSDFLMHERLSIREDSPQRQSILGVAVRERRAVYNNDIAADAAVGGKRRQEAVRRGYRSAISLPLIVDDGVYGSLSLFAREPGFFDDEEVGLLTELVGNISFAIEHMARQDKLEKLSRIRAVSGEINAVIVRVRDRDELLRETCRIASEHGKFELVWIASLDMEREEIRPIAWSGFSAETAHAVTWASMSAARGTLGEAIRTGKPAIRNDIEVELPVGRLRQEALAMGYGSTVCLPLLVDGKVIATVILFAAGKNFFDEEEIALLSEVAADVSFALQSIAQQEKVEFLSYYDTITGLPNRSLFMDRARQQLHSRGGEPFVVVLMVLNLQRFRSINESYGRNAGDELLKEVTRRLANAVSSAATLARIGADNFGIVMRGIPHAAAAVHAIENQLLPCFHEPFKLTGAELRIAARVGVAMFPADGDEADKLFGNAEAALKKARASGETYLFYAAEMNARAAQALSLETRLRKAVEAQQFVLHYQPKINLSTGAICGLEALIRWQEPGVGLVPPGAFIPVLEETGLIIEAGKWALGRALADHREWTARGRAAPRIAVNVSALQLQRHDFVDTVIEMVQREGDNPDALELEVTESMLMRDVQSSIRALTILRGLGIRLAMDDFGTGYSSLSYMARLPIDTVKIDRSFVNAMAGNRQDMAIVTTIIALAHALHLKVVAEGVETAEQASTLASLKCDEVQGYFYSKPVPAAEIEALLPPAEP